jgi:MFS family permease
MLQAGMNQTMAMLMASIDSIVYIIGAMLPVIIVERVGRRKIGLWGLVAQAITLFCIGGSQKAYTDGYGKNASNAAIAFTMLFNFVFGASWLGLSWLYPAEIFSTALRAKGNSLSTAANWLGNFVVAMLSPVLFEYITFWTYILFGFLNLLFVPMVYYWFAETKGLSLEQVEILFATQEVKDDLRSIESHHRHEKEEQQDLEKNAYKNTEVKEEYKLDGSNKESSPGSASVN